MTMAQESMTTNERLWAAIRLEQPDRVPVVPLVTAEPAAHLAGMTLAEVAGSNQKAIEAYRKVLSKFGGWDSMHGGPITPLQQQVTNIYPMKMRIPGRDLPDGYMFQLVEEEFMKPEDYDRICEMGIDAFYYEDYLWRITDLTPDDVQREVTNVLTMWPEFDAELKKYDMRPLILASDFHPFFRLSLMRSMVAFTQDLYYNPEPVERTIKQITKELIPKNIAIAKGSGIDTCLFTDERASAFYYPLAVFERFWWPYTEEIVDAFWSEGIVTVFHLDTCWDKNLPYFKRLPRGSAVVGLDSTTDIFLAKQVLRDHLCIHGDVPASLLSLGKPEEVEAYCKRLIDEVGAGGGLILGTGCATPPDCKPENFRAMIETGKNYG
ncbi:MAG: hypothetical protein DRI39_01035 [Chloroflexi bacterium]|nr:MAG: hypothetical protein DRI39_01035 [Chloroflexota bacterium]